MAEWNPSTASSLKEHLNYLIGQTNACSAEGDEDKHLDPSLWRSFMSEEPYLTAADWMRIWLMEVTGGTEMKVNHCITFYMYNPTLHISSSIAIKAPPSA